METPVLPAPAPTAPVFLTARWQLLLMLNFPVAPEILKPAVPHGTELDFHEGQTFLSLVGFCFLNTQLKGIPIPFHQNFEEVNLRFYVRRPCDEGPRRGVVFIRELVPRRAVSWIARSNIRSTAETGKICTARSFHRLSMPAHFQPFSLRDRPSGSAKAGKSTDSQSGDLHP